MKNGDPANPRNPEPGSSRPGTPIPLNHKVHSYTVVPFSKAASKLGLEFSVHLGQQKPRVVQLLRWKGTCICLLQSSHGVTVFPGYIPLGPPLDAPGIRYSCAVCWVLSPTNMVPYLCF